MRRLARLTATVGCALALGCAPPTPTPAPTVAVEPAVPDGFEEHFRAEWPATIDVELREVTIDMLREEPREWVDGTVVIDGERFVVEVRLKGHGSFSPISERPSFKVRFDQGWRGHRTLVLNNYLSDDSRIHERLATEFFHRRGLPAARAGHAFVHLNGELRGLYGVLEDVDPGMLRQWFADGDGSLYEMFDGDFQPGLTDGLEHEEGPEVPQLIQHITDDLATGNVTGFDLAIEHFERRQFMDFWAITALVGQTDAFPYSLPGDDVYLYLDPDTERFHFIPHGLDEAFFPRGRRIADSNGMLARRCLTREGCREELRSTVWGLASNIHDEDWDASVQELLTLSTPWRRHEREQLGTPFPGELAEHLSELDTWFVTRLPVVHDELE